MVLNAATKISAAVCAPVGRSLERPGLNQVGGEGQLGSSVRNCTMKCQTSVFQESQNVRDLEGQD